MSSYNNWLRKLESERVDRAFASKQAVFLIWAPCYIALGNGLLWMAIDPGGETNYPLLMACLFGLVAASISSNRRKILQQDKVIQQLEEQLREANSHNQQSSAGDNQKASPEE